MLFSLQTEKHVFFFASSSSFLSTCSFDVGRVLATQTVGIRPDVRREELSSELAACGADLMIRVLQDLDHFREGSWVQDDRLATYGK